MPAPFTPGASPRQTAESADTAAPARTTYGRACAGFKHALGEAITRAIFDISTAVDCNVCAIRTGETTDALVGILATIIALRPEARVPSQLRELTEQIGKRLLRDVRDFRERNPDFDKTFFRGNDVGGRA
jgi:hypothetical protein